MNVKNSLLLMYCFLFFANFLLAQEKVFPYCENNKWGIVNENLKVISSPTYDYISFFQNHDKKNAIAICRDSNGLGALNRMGETIMACKYKDIQIIDKDGEFAFFSESGKKGLFSFKQQKEILPPQYSYIKLFKNKTFFEVTIGSGNMKKRGVVDQKNNIIIPIEHDFIDVDSELGNEVKFRLITGLDKEYVTVKKSTIYNYRPSKVEKKRKGGTMNPYDDFAGGDMAISIDENSNTYKPTIDLDPEKLEPGVKLLKTYYSYSAYRKFGLVKNTKRMHGIIDENSKLIVPFEYAKIWEEQSLGGLIIKTQDSLLGIFSMESAKIIVPAKYESIRLGKNLTVHILNNKEIDQYLVVGLEDLSSRALVDKKTGKIYSPK